MKSSLTLNKLLDVLHTTSTEIATITQRRKRIRREHVISFVNVASIFVSTIATVFPQLGILANILNNLQKQTESVCSELKPSYISNLMLKLQTINVQIKSATHEERLRLEAQREMLLKLVCDYKQSSL